MSNILIFCIILLAMFAWLNPTHVFPWVSSNNEFAIFLSLVLLCFYSVVKKNKFFINNSHVIVLIISIIPLVQFFVGKIYFFGEALVSFIYVFSFGLALIIGFNIGKSTEKNNFYFILSSMFVFCGLLSIYMQLTQWLMFGEFVVFIVELPLGARPSANFAQPNILATFYILSICSLIYLYEKSYIKGLVLFLAFLFFIFGVALTQSRTPWVYTISLLVWFLWKGKTFESKINFNKLVVGSILYFIAFLIIPYLSKIIKFEQEKDGLIRFSGGYDRLGMWYQLLVALKNKPWFGYGWNQVSTAQVETIREVPFYVWTEHSHNILLDLLIWNGIPIGILIILFFSIWLYRLGKNTNTKESFWFLALIGAVLVHGMLEFPLEYAFFLIPIGLLLGGVESEYGKESNFMITHIYIKIILILMLFIYALVFMEYRRLEKEIEVARYRDLKIGSYEQSLNDKINILFLTQLDARLKLIELSPYSGMSKKQLEFIKNTSYRYANLAALEKYTVCLFLNGDYAEAEKQIYIINKLHRKNLTLKDILDMSKK